MRTPCCENRVRPKIQDKDFWCGLVTRYKGRVAVLGYCDVELTESDTIGADNRLKRETHFLRSFRFDLITDKGFLDMRRAILAFFSC